MPPAETRREHAYMLGAATVVGVGLSLVLNGGFPSLNPPSTRPSHSGDAAASPRASTSPVADQSQGDVALLTVGSHPQEAAAPVPSPAPSPPPAATSSAPRVAPTPAPAPAAETAPEHPSAERPPSESGDAENPPPPPPENGDPEPSPSPLPALPDPLPPGIPVL